VVDGEEGTLFCGSYCAVNNVFKAGSLVVDCALPLCAVAVAELQVYQGRYFGPIIVGFKGGTQIV
jgi:hypothetical protein